MLYKKAVNFECTLGTVCVNANSKHVQGGLKKSNVNFILLQTKSSASVSVDK